MSTNYYAVRTRPTIEEPIHIGKSSGGWKFLFEAHNDRYNTPPVVWNTYKQVMLWLHNHVEVSKEYVILDEYDDIVSLDEFKAIVNRKQNENNPDDFTYARNVDGYRFMDGEFR